MTEEGKRIQLLEKRLEELAALLDASEADSIRAATVALFSSEELEKIENAGAPTKEDLRTLATDCGLRVSEECSAALGLVQHAETLLSGDDAASSLPEVRGSLRAANGMLEEVMESAKKLAQYKLLVAVMADGGDLVARFEDLLGDAVGQLEDCFAVAREQREHGEEGEVVVQGFAVETQLRRASLMIADVENIVGEARSAAFGTHDASAKMRFEALQKADMRVSEIKAIIDGIYRLVMKSSAGSFVGEEDQDQSRKVQSMTMFTPMSVPPPSPGAALLAGDLGGNSSSAGSRQVSDLTLLARAAYQTLPREERRHRIWAAAGVDLDQSDGPAPEKKESVTHVKRVARLRRYRHDSYQNRVRSAATEAYLAEEERRKAKMARERDIDVLEPDPGLGDRTSLWVGDGYTSRWATSLRGEEHRPPGSRYGRTVKRRASIRKPRPPKKLDWHPGVYRPHGGLGFGTGYSQYSFDGRPRRPSSIAAEEAKEEEAEEDAVRQSFAGSRARRGTAVPQLISPNSDEKHKQSVGNALTRLREAMDDVREQHRIRTREQRLQEQMMRLQSSAGKLYEEERAAREKRRQEQQELLQQHRSAWSNILGSPIASAPALTESEKAAQKRRILARRGRARQRKLQNDSSSPTNRPPRRRRASRAHSVDNTRQRAEQRSRRSSSVGATVNVKRGQGAKTLFQVLHENTPSQQQQNPQKSSLPPPPPPSKNEAEEDSGPTDEEVQRTIAEIIQAGRQI